MACAEQFKEGISASSTLLEGNAEVASDVPSILTVESCSEVFSESLESSQASAEADPSSSNIHQNPDWLKELKINFHTEIISPCSARTRQAVDGDEYVEVWLSSS